MKVFFLFAHFAAWIAMATAGSIRYCIPKRVVNSGLNKACDKMHKAQHEIQCVLASDRLSCLNLLSLGKADFMVAEPEDLRVMSAYNESGLVVTHQLKKFAESRAQKDVEMVVVVKSDSPGTAITTKGKKLCYIGLEASRMPRFDYFYNTYFESWLFPKSCEANKNVLENRLASISKHFESACIAGPWSLDRKMDTDLKSKYKNLCALCGNPRSCDDDDRFYGMTGALTCLQQGVGNIAWLSRSEASKYFSRLGSYGFSLLCPDGTTRILSSKKNNTCTWISDPRPVIVANKNVASIVLGKVSDSGAEKSKFYQVIHASYLFSYLKKLENPVRTKEYLLKRYWSASVKSKSTCRSERLIRWCVSSSLEARKCQSLVRASDALELSPGFVCVRKPSRDQCIRALSTFGAEVIVAKANERSQLEKSGLKSIMEMMGNGKDEQNNVAAVVRKESRFKTMGDLKGAKACFSGYGSAGWKAVYSALKSDSDQQRPSDIKAISDFFKDSCVLNLSANNRSFPKNLYSLCKNNASHLTPEESTFKCLEDGADVAFVNVSAVRAYASRKVVFNMKYTSLCPKRKHDEKSSCFLAKVTLGSVVLLIEIIVNKNITKVKEDDVLLMFAGLNRYFGRTYDRETPMFEMYGPYEDEPNVLFADGTMKLQRTLHDVHYVGYDVELVNASKMRIHAEIRKPNKSRNFSERMAPSFLAICILLCLDYGQTFLLIKTA